MTTFELDTPNGPAVQSPYGPVLLADLFAMDPAEGKLTWKARPGRWFNDARSSSAWNAKCAGAEALRASGGRGYRQGTVFNRMTKAHRVIAAMHFGKWPEADVDHINGVRGDNRVVNLRCVSLAENRRNKRTYRNNTSGAVGVCLDGNSGLWRARIGGGGKILVGYFASFDEAVAARKQAEAALGYHMNHGRAKLGADGNVAKAQQGRATAPFRR